MAQNVQQNIDNWKVKLDKALHEKNVFTDMLDKIEQKTNVRRLYLVLGLGVFLALYLMVGYGSQFLCNFIGFLYPAYASVKAIETKEKDDDTKWLTYWVVYGFFSLLECFTDIFLFWIPFYSFLKCLFLMYCMLPTSWNGSITIYYKVIRPFVLRHQKKVDEALDRAGDIAQGVLDEAEETAKDAASDSLKRHVVDSAKVD